MNTIDGSDRHIKTEEGMTSEHVSALLRLTHFSSPAFSASHRTRYQPACLGASVLDPLTLGRPRQYPCIHQRAFGFRQYQRSRRHSIAFTQDNISVSDADKAATAVTKRCYKWRRGNERGRR